ncbi:uncharacterized protein DKFZp434B061-like [Heterocephalus glaber]|uniref:Uncharacterized protein DKFZp434B061-like n=1 Tax=Heterocephalus glaber TaxID=10181 RepID=A0AAX6QVA8_HETGA|nr:uncharacterized protein DKFZp434B061-like [Heterocephalus glaber]
MHTSAGLHTCGAVTKFPQAAGAGAEVHFSRTLSGSPVRTGSTYPRPAPGRSSSADGVRERGRSSSRRPHPRCLFLLLGCRHSLLGRRSPQPYSPSRLRAAPPTGTSPPTAPPAALPPNFPPRWRPRSWPAARPRDRPPCALSQ